MRDFRLHLHDPVLLGPALFFELTQARHEIRLRQEIQDGSHRDFIVKRQCLHSEIIRRGLVRTRLLHHHAIGARMTGEDMTQFMCDDESIG